MSSSAGSPTTFYNYKIIVELPCYRLGAVHDVCPQATFKQPRRAWSTCKRPSGGVGAQAVILKSETYNFHRLDLTRQAGFIVTIYDEDGLRLAATMPFSTSAEVLGEARKIVDNRVEGPKR